MTILLQLLLILLLLLQLLCLTHIFLFLQLLLLLNLLLLLLPLQVITSSLEPDLLASYCLDLAWKVSKHQDFKACNLSNYVADVAQEAGTSPPPPHTIHI